MRRDRPIRTDSISPRLIKPNTDVRPKFNRAAASSTVNKTFSASDPPDERATSHLTSHR